jgi:hypothetical protein
MYIGHFQLVSRSTGREVERSLPCKRFVNARLIAYLVKGEAIRLSSYNFNFAMSHWGATYPEPRAIASKFKKPLYATCGAVTASKRPREAVGARPKRRASSGTARPMVAVPSLLGRNDRSVGAGCGAPTRKARRQHLSRAKGGASTLS